MVTAPRVFLARFVLVVTAQSVARVHLVITALLALTTPHSIHVLLALTHRVMHSTLHLSVAIASLGSTARVQPLP